MLKKKEENQFSMVAETSITSNYKTMSDKELLILTKEGVQGAYNEVYRRYAPRMLAHAERILRNRQDAEDIIQEVFGIRLSANTKKLYQTATKETEKLQSWLYRVVQNAAFDILRRTDARRRTSERITKREADEIEYQQETNPERVYVRKEQKWMVREAWNQTNPRYQRFLELQYDHDLCSAEIAEIEGTPTPNVEVVMHRARQSVKKNLERMVCAVELL